MKTTLLLISFFLLALHANAQENWPPIGAKWYYSFQLFSMKVIGPVEYITFEVEKDTVMNDTTCRKIRAEYHKQSGQVLNLGNEYIFSTEDRVYNFHDDYFYLLYDFSLQINDTINLFLGTNSDIYNQISGVTLTKNYLKHTVTDRDSIEINGNKYLEITLTYIGAFEFDILIFEQSRIIKGIGSRSFITGEWFSAIEELDIYGPLRCYSDGTTEYTTDIPCDTIISGIEESNIEEKLMVFPNPIENGTVLAFPNEEGFETTIIIVNSVGNIVKKASTTMDYMQIDPEEYSSDIYFYTVFSDKKLKGAGKFVKR